jgi:hypothetical protein
MHRRIPPGPGTEAPHAPNPQLAPLNEGGQGVANAGDVPVHWGRVVPDAQIHTDGAGVNRHDFDAAGRNPAVHKRGNTHGGTRRTAGVPNAKEASNSREWADGVLRQWRGGGHDAVIHTHPSSVAMLATRLSPKNSSTDTLSTRDSLICWVVRMSYLQEHVETRGQSWGIPHRHIYADCRGMLGERSAGDGTAKSGRAGAGGGGTWQQ